MTEVAPAALTTGDTEAVAAAKASLADKPMLVYVVSDDPTDNVSRKLEDVVFRNEKLGLGTKFFKNVKVSAGDALTDRLLKDSGDTAPRIVLVSRDYKAFKVLQGKQISAGKMLKGMSALVKKEYTDSFDKMVRAYIKLLNERDRLEGKKSKLAADLARLQDKPNASKGKKIAREQKKLDVEFEAWNEKHQKLLTFRRRGEAKAEA